MRRLCLLLLMLTLTISVGNAVHADDSVWPVTQRCFGEATPPPQGWTFSGTLLMTSPGRLHAFQQGWVTPHIVVFPPNIPYSLVDGLLSPGGNWYALVTGRQYNIGLSPVNIFDTTAIEVYSTTTGKKYTIPWKNEYTFLDHLYGFKLYWLDNQHLLWDGGTVINPSTQTVESWDSHLNLSQEFLSLSPDASSIVYANWLEQMRWKLNLGGDDIPLPSLTDVGGWRPDSQAFAAYTKAPDSQQADQLVLFDLNGNITARLFAVTSAGRPDTLMMEWSPNAHYLLFSADHLYIADLESKQVIDTCISDSGFMSAVWSPSSAQIGLIDRRDRLNRIQIFDLQTWERYVVGYHSGNIIGWRDDD